MKVSVLLSSYNGERYIEQQIMSILSQSIKPDLLVRDDGSSDLTSNILKGLQEKGYLSLLADNSHIGVTKSFFSLINNAPQSDFYALSDQDDYWLKTKIESAIETLKEYNAKEPLLYIGRFTPVDQNLNLINFHIGKLYSYTDFPHSLFFHTGPGCTFVFNEPARRELLKVDYKNLNTSLHDSLIHKLIAMKGKVILDENSYVLYRQHSSNLIGYDQSLLSKSKTFLSGRNRNYRSKVAKEILDFYKSEISPMKKALLVKLADYRKDFDHKKELIKERKFKTNTIYDYIIGLLILLGLI